MEDDGEDDDADVTRRSRDFVLPAAFAAVRLDGRGDADLRRFDEIAARHQASAAHANAAPYPTSRTQIAARQAVDRERTIAAGRAAAREYFTEAIAAQATAEDSDL